MAKIRTVEALDDAISAETAWRKQELTTALKLIQESNGPARKANIRSGVLLLYAHWEGWVKGVARLYVRYVNTMRYPYTQLSEAFLGNALKTRMSAINEASAPTTHNQFASFIKGGLSGRASLSESLIQTESNLSSGVFFDILDRLGLKKREIYKFRANMIDLELVHQRNTIAHGQHLEISKDDYIALRASTMEILESFTDDIRNAASTGAHLAIPEAQA